MHCHECGTTIHNAAKFCTKCGAAVLLTETKSIESNDNSIWIVGSIVFMALLLLGGFFIFGQSSSDNTVSTTPSTVATTNVSPAIAASNDTNSVATTPKAPSTSGTKNSQTPASSSKKDLATIIKEWEPTVALVSCFWNMYPALNDQGSGFLFALTNQSNAVMTNKHVFYDSRYGGADSCNIVFPYISHSQTFNVTRSATQISSTADWGYLLLGLEAFITADDATTNVATVDAKNFPICSGVADIGTNVVVLGYPDYGGSSITATQGIVSGFDGSYYTTSAKISAGNSGGAAIDTDKDCAVVYGEYGNLGRIYRFTKDQ
jgi:hypothetical protein